MRIVGNNPQLSRQTQATASGAITGGLPVVVNTDGTVSSITSSNAITVYNAATTGPQSVATNGSGTVVIAYRDEGNSNKGTAIVGTISGGNITFGSEVIFESGQIAVSSSSTVNVVYDVANAKFVIFYVESTNSNYPTAIVGTVSGTSISFGTAVVIDSNTSVDIVGSYDSTAEKIVVPFYGFSNALTHAVVGTVSGTSISFGGRTQISSKRPADLCAVYDSNADKTVVVFRDDADTKDGFAVVCTVSGTSISAGSVTNFSSSVDATQIGMDFDSSANKVVIAYVVNQSGHSDLLAGKAVVGTVSGTSISFGSEVVFNSANSMYSSATFDSSNNKVVIVYRDGGNSNRGTAIVGTVSGTSISFGSEVVFDGNNGSEWTAATFDSNSNKVVVFYQDDTDTETNAIIGTVSGTSISFGTAVQVLDGNNVYHNATFNSTANTVLVVLQEETTEDIELFIGTVSGTSITFGTALKVAEHAAQVAVVYDTNAQKGVVLYDDDDDSSKGKGVVTTVNTTATNLTPENYVGISNGAYSNSATATIQISGELDDAQSSLTPGQVYYVQGDGSLGLKPDVPAVVAGIAISATKLMLELSKEPAVTEQNSTAITSSSNAATINLRDGDNFTHTLTENVTYTFSNPAASGRVSAFTLKVIQDSSARTITWPSSVDWAAATAPTLSTGSGNVDVFVFITYDGGTNYYGFTAGQAMA